MASFTQRLTLDVAGNYLPFYKYMKQGDGDSTFVVVTITANGTQLIPAAGDSAIIRVQKPDNTMVVQEATINNDGTVTARITSSMTAAPGLARADICIIGENEETLSTATFWLDVDASPLSGMQSTNDFLNLVALLKAGEEMLGGYETALQHLEAIQAAAEAAKLAAQGHAGDAANYAGSAGTQATQARNSAVSAAGSAQVAEGWAVGRRAGVELGEGSPYYHNNAKYYSERASEAVSIAGHDVEFDEEEEALYLLDAYGARIGNGAPISVGIDDVYLETELDESDNSWYLVMYDNEEKETELARVQLPATGGGGGGGASAITLSNVVKATTVRNGASALFGFTATSSDDTDITVKWYVDGVLLSTQNGVSGGSFSFEARGHLKDSNTSTVRADISSESGASLRRTWTVTSTAFSLAWGGAIQPIMLYTESEDIYVVVDVSAAGGTTNAVTVAVGNNSKTSNVSGSRSITVKLERSWFSVGANTVTASMVSGTDATDRAEDISFVVLWGSGASAPIVAFETSAMTVTQYDLAIIRYFVYDPSHETANCEIQINEEDARSVSVGREIQSFRYTPQEAGNYTVALRSGTASTSMTLSATASDYNIGIIAGESLQYNLDPAGHSNSDNDREQFGGLTFSADFDWVNGGFQTDAAGTSVFVVKKGNRVMLPTSLFVDDDNLGKTIDLSFRIVNSDQYDAVALSDLNNGGTKGLVLRANEGELRMDNAAGQVFRYCEENRIDMSILVEGTTTQRVVTVWMDGIPSKVNPYTAGMLTQNENAAVIGSDHCDVWIYSIRRYNSALEQKDMIQNYIASGNTTAEKVARCIANAIYDSNGVITPASLHAAAPNLTIIEIEAARMTTGKKDPVPATIRIIDGGNVLELLSSEGTVFLVQGTSSQAYARSALNMDFNFKSSGKTYAISENAIPVSYLNVKVNVASSENANNSCVANWYNRFQPYRIPARANPAVRDTVEGKPCAVFFKNTGTSAVWVSSQLVQPGDTILYVMGDLCNSKKNLEVFGQDGTGDHPTKGCIEVSGNDTAAQRFRATSSYDSEAGEWITNGTTDFEWRMEPSSEDLDEVVAAWDAAVAWVVSTIGDSAKFRAEVGNYFAIDSLLFHFLYLEFFGGYDQTCKNTFYSYDYDAVLKKYLWNICKEYDGDTIIGYDNDGNPLGDYGLDYNDTIDGTPTGRTYFNGQNNPIWCNIQEAFYNELSAMYISLRSEGAWNAQDIAELWDSYQAKRPHAAMAQDMYTKYILPYKTTGVVINGNTLGYDDNYLSRLAGSKTYQRKQFLTYQTDYMDGKYGYYNKSSSMQFRTNGESATKALTIKSYAKTYITVVADDSRIGSQKVAAGAETVFQRVSVGNNTTIYVTPDRLVQHVRPLNETQNSTFAASGAAKLMEAVLGGESENTAWLSGTGVNIPSVLLKAVSIRNLVNFSGALNLSANVELEELDTRGTQAGLITLPSYAPITSAQLNACTGIVAYNLNKVATFTMAGGSSLTSVRVENCNSVVNDALAGYLAQAVDAGGSATRRIRMIGVNWTLSNINMLYKIARTWKGFNSMGVEQDDPVITGTVYVENWTHTQLDAVRAKFPDLTVTASAEGEVPDYTVTFRNTDGTLLNTQVVSQGSAPIDPRELEYDAIPTPTRENTISTAYTFDGWSWTNGGALISDLSAVSITENTDIFAHYAETARQYTVTWYNGTAQSRELLATLTVPYGSEAVYPGTGFPVSPNDGNYSTYYLFRGWDKSTGFVQSDLDVYAQYDSATAPSSGSFSSFSPEQLKALVETGILSPTGADNTLIASGDTIDIIAGHDYDFANVASHELISLKSPRTFDGSTSFKPQIDGEDILLFDTDKSWTLAIDFAFDTSCAAGGCLAASYHSNGFVLRYSGGGSVRYGLSAAQAASSNGIREIVILRKKTGDSNLYVYASNKNNDAIYYAALSQGTAPVHNAPLAFGAQIADDGFVDNSGKGTVYWAKLWDDDLGDDLCRHLASWPRQTFGMKASGTSQYAFRNFVRVDNNRYVNCTIILNELLEETHRMNATNTNAGGWKDSAMRAWLNSRVWGAIPIKWKQICLKVYVHSNTGYQATGLVDPPAEDMVFMVSIADIGFQTTTSPYNLESEAPFTTFTNDASRIKHLNFGLGAASIWWTRSPNTTSETYFWVVSPSGGAYGNGASSLFGVAFGINF